MSETKAAQPATTVKPPYELWLGLAGAALPHVLVLLLGSYGRVVTIAPLAIGLVGVSAAGLAVACLELRDHRREGRAVNWIIWATIGLGAAWIAYALYIGLIWLLAQVFCINQLCRGPLG